LVLTEGSTLSQHTWVAGGKACARTEKVRNANIILSLSENLCVKESKTLLTAARFLIGESVHHFGWGDAFTDWMKVALAQGFKELKPNRYYQLATEYENSLKTKTQINLIGKIGYNPKKKIFIGIAQNKKIIISTQPGSYVEGSGQQAGVFRLNLEQSRIMGSHENKNKHYGCNTPVTIEGNRYTGKCDMFFGGSVQQYYPQLNKYLTVDYYPGCKFTYYVEIEPIVGRDAINVIIRKPIWLDARSELHYDDPNHTCRQSKELVTEAAWFPLKYR